jgi:hypothetical protein
MTALSMQHRPARYSVRSLSPAFWYVYDAAKAQRERGRGQVGRAYGSAAEAHAAIAKATGAQP